MVKRYAGAATATAFMLLGNYEDALDASQDALARAWQHIESPDLTMPFCP